jgi:hypothetical protein
VDARWNYLIMIGFMVIGGQAWAVDVQAGPEAYALVVGSNRAGPGQEELRFAREDAQRVLEVLTELGGYHKGDVRLLLDPGKEDLVAAIGEMGKRLAVHSERGEQSVFLFYYSGHARAHALNMGEEEVELLELREKLTALPSTVTVAILDACQTGAISRIKGAEPAADFSYNSVNNLNTAGVVVMASSSASELSQESESLGSSYFTHHLIVGLRGAADEDQDGKVTLSEAYRYAYNRTLVATAATAVGKQHVTLETELRGKGEMVLTRPAEASSALNLPGEMDGEVLVHKEPQKTVVAEISKAKGDPVRLAFPPGEYVTYVRVGDQVLKCEMALGEGKTFELKLDDCVEAEPEEIGIKGAVKREAWYERFGLELGIGGIWGVHDEYSRRLEDFGFDEQWLLFDQFVTISVNLTYEISPYISVVAGWSMLDTGSYQRPVWDMSGVEQQQRFEWSAHGVGIYLRGSLPLFDGVLVPYVQAGGGLTWGDTVYRDPLQASEVVDDQTYFGYHLSAAAGLQIMIWDFLGLYGQASYTTAPAIENRQGDVHDSGGPGIVLGIRGAL